MYVRTLGIEDEGEYQDELPDHLYEHELTAGEFYVVRLKRSKEDERFFGVEYGGMLEYTRSPGTNHYALVTLRERDWKQIWRLPIKLSRAGMLVGGRGVVLGYFVRRTYRVPDGAKTRPTLLPGEPG